MPRMPDIFNSASRQAAADNSAAESAQPEPAPIPAAPQPGHSTPPQSTRPVPPAAEHFSQTQGFDHQPAQPTPVQPDPKFAQDPPVQFYDQEMIAEPSPQPRRKRHVDDYSETLKFELPSSNPLNSYAAKPVGVGFSTQHQDEEVVLLLRQHPVTQLKWIFIALVLIFVPFLFSAMPAIVFLPGRFEIAALIGWYLLVLGYSLEAFLSWFYNVYIITDERVIDVDFHSLIFKNISAAKIDNIEDVTERTGGALRAIFNFGTVKIQTAAAQQEFEFDNVPFPAKVTSVLNELILEEEREKMEGRVT